jgi:hypothetical protein
MTQIKAGFTLKEFKSEYNLCYDGDDWGSTMEAWFECAGQMNKRGLHIPPEWNYRPAMGSDGTDEESYWNELFEMATDKQLVTISNYLAKRCDQLKKQGKDY